MMDNQTPKHAVEWRGINSLFKGEYLALVFDGPRVWMGFLDEDNKCLYLATEVLHQFAVDPGKGIRNGLLAVVPYHALSVITELELGERTSVAWLSKLSDEGHANTLVERYRAVIDPSPIVVASSPMVQIDLSKLRSE